MTQDYQVLGHKHKLAYLMHQDYHCNFLELLYTSRMQHGSVPSMIEKRL